MTRRTFRVVNIVEILIHWKAGRNKADVARFPSSDGTCVEQYWSGAVSCVYSIARYRAGCHRRPY